MFMYYAETSSSCFVINVFSLKVVRTIFLVFAFQCVYPVAFYQTEEFHVHKYLARNHKNCRFNTCIFFYQVSK